MQEYRVKIGKMTCTNCSNAIERLTKKLEGVENASVSYINASGAFLVKDESVKQSIKDKIVSLGFELLADDEDMRAFKLKELDKLKINLSLSICISLVAMALMMSWHSFTSELLQVFLGSFGIFYCGRNFFSHALKGLLNKAMDMNTLVSLGSLSAFVYSFLTFFKIFEGHLYFAEASMIISFVLFGKFLEERAKFKASLYENNTKSTQKTRLILENGEFKEVHASFLQIGDIIFVQAGEVLSADGIVLEGKVELDTSAINGEFIPIIKQKGDLIEAGSLVISGSIKLKIGQKAMDSKIELIKDMIFKASEAKMPIARLVDRISSYFVAGIVLLALFVFVFWSVKEGLNLAFLHASAVLLISCPCALGLATPIALVLALNNAAKHGILIKNPAVLENFKKLSYMLFDKTGTLSEEKLSIYTHNLNEADFKLLASLESLSSHPIAKAFEDEAKMELKNLPQFITARGLSYQEGEDFYLAGNEALLKENAIEIPNELRNFVNENAKEAPILVYFVKNKTPLGVLCLKNELRKGVKELINFLKLKGIQSLILSGDNATSVAQNAAKLDISEFRANLKPEDKFELIKSYQKSGLCAFVGDGINDAAALAKADIGIAMQGASALAKSSGDIILLKDDLSKISYLVKLAQKSFTIIKQNLFWAFFYNALCIPLAAGLFPKISLSPHIAALAMCLSSFFVVMNSLRLSRDLI